MTTSKGFDRTMAINNAEVKLANFWLYETKWLFLFIPLIKAAYLSGFFSSQTDTILDLYKNKSLDIV